jgi:hypothetical protein
MPIFYGEAVLGQAVIQGYFESCADVLTCDRTPQKLTIVPIMPYTNVHVSRKRG